MDNPEQEEEKYTNIRQTIRNVFLPLAQIIYDENPSDIVLFCYRYFGNLLRERENDQNDANDFLSISKNEFKRNSNEDSNGTLSSNIKGSSSEPILTDDKHQEYLTLREASSCDTPSCHSKSVSPLLHCNMADAMSRIGDQSTPVENQSGIGIDAKAGDTTTYQNEAEITKNDKSPNSKKISSKLGQENCENLDGSNICNGDTKEEIEMKSPSPTSSFGFIPHITECNSDEEPNLSHFSETFEGKTNEQIDEFTKKFSETFQSLAQKLNTAESNFNEEFRNVNEITDVLQGESEKPELNMGNGEGEDIEEDSPNENRNKNELNGFDVDAVSDENGNLNNEMNDYTCHIKDDADCIKTGSIRREEIEIKSERVNDGLKVDVFPTDNKDSEEGKRLSRTESKNSVHQDEDDDFYNKTNNHEPVPSESWRKRWYEAHPRLDDCRNSFRWTQPRQNRFHPDNARSYLRPDIGEAGDVPSHRFCTQENYLNGNLDYSMEQNSTLSSRTQESNDFCSSSSLNDISSRVPPSRPYRNLSDSIHLSTNASDIAQNTSTSCTNQSSECGKQQELKAGLKRESFDTKDKTKSRSTVTLYEYLHEDVIAKTDFDDHETSSSENNGTEKISQSSDSSKEAEFELRNKNSETITLKSSLKRSSPKSSDNEKQTKEAGQKTDIFTSNREVTEENGKPPGSEEIVASETDIKAVKGTPSGDEISSTMKKHIMEHNTMSKNVEPGLNSACGDFSLSSIHENKAGDCELEAPEREGGENCANNADQNEQNTVSGAISVEYLKEAIEQVKDKQQEFKDACECLNFTAFSNSDSSNIESDYSETENN